MEEPYLYKIHVKNFKSISDQVINLSNFNVLIGPNGSGKTNILEVFKFLKLINQSSVPYNPGYPWWGYKNIVHMGDLDKPIYFNLFFRVDSIKFSYSLTISEFNASITILEEKFVIDELLSLTKIQDIVTVEYDKKFLKANQQEILDLVQNKPHLANFDTLKKNMNGKINSFITQRLFSQALLTGGSVSYSSEEFKAQNGETYLITAYRTNKQNLNEEENEYELLITPRIPIDLRKQNRFYDGISFFGDIIIGYSLNNVFIHNVNFSAIKKPIFPRKSLAVEEDASNIIEILYNWFIKNGGKLPERITLALKRLFPDIQLSFTLTEDGRIYLMIKENDYELLPPSQPDGLLKLLVVLTSLELPSRIVLIDELENTLHANILRYLIDEIKNETEKTVIITTHSPTVVDLVKIEDLILVEKTDQTTTKRIEDPQKLRERLHELGITNSESWLEGTMTEFS